MTNDWCQFVCWVQHLAVLKCLGSPCQSGRDIGIMDAAVSILAFSPIISKHEVSGFTNIFSSPLIIGNFKKSIILFTWFISLALWNFQDLSTVTVYYNRHHQTLMGHQFILRHQIAERSVINWLQTFVTPWLKLINDICVKNYTRMQLFLIVFLFNLC